MMNKEEKKLSGLRTVATSVYEHLLRKIYLSCKK
jgi:hypothetical protein